MSNLQIGWIGLGLMGNPMSRRLLGSGYAVRVFDLVREKAKPAIDAGGAFCDTITELGALSDAVFSMIPDDKALRAITLCEDSVLSGMRKGSLFVDMSTVSPAVSAEVAAACKVQGVGYLRAPVNGSTLMAEAGELTVLVSGPREHYDRMEPLFNLLGATVFHVGEGEQARFLKIMLNIMIGISSAMVGEALVFGEAGGMKWQQMLDVIKASVLCSPLIGYKLAPLRARDFQPAFRADMMGKDFDLALDAAKAANIPLPLTAQVRQFWSMMHAQGKGELDFFAYVSMLEDMAKVSPKM